VANNENTIPPFPPKKEKYQNKNSVYILLRKIFFLKKEGEMCEGAF
jgi:hypothetical protein